MQKNHSSNSVRVSFGRVRKEGRGDSIQITAVPQFREVTPSVQIISNPDGEEALKLIEKVGRVCYQSQDRITEGSAEKFVSARLYKDHHETLLEHYGFTALFEVDRGVADQILRHRHISPAMSSTRYCDYSKEKFGSRLSCIKPLFRRKLSNIVWSWACNCAQWAYKALRKLGEKPETARTVLPFATACQLCVTANLREWRYIFKLRTDSHAQPETQAIMNDLLEQARAIFPIIFDQI